MSLALVFRFCTSLAFGDLHLSSMESTGDVIFFWWKNGVGNAKKAKEKEKKGLVGEIKTIFKHVFV